MGQGHLSCQTVGVFARFVMLQESNTRCVSRSVPAPSCRIRRRANDIINAGVNGRCSRARLPCETCGRAEGFVLPRQPASSKRGGGKGPGANDATGLG
jgi:hypothetical protein